jgi:hypothetical protein
MVHTYEVLVDVREYFDLIGTTSHSGTSRYEIDAESKEIANGMARTQLRNEHPKCVEYDVRVTRLLK